jgi:hypothetical protein
MGTDTSEWRDLPDGSLTREEVNGLLDRLDEQADTIRRYQRHSRIEQEWRRDIEAANRKRYAALYRPEET